MSRPKPVTLAQALFKIGECFDRQSIDGTDCALQGLNQNRCKVCRQYVSPSSAWMFLAALGKTSLQLRDDVDEHN